MELRVLGVHNLESEETRLSSYLIDGVLALDAGSLTRSLTFQDQQAIRAILLTHRHFDHVRDLLTLGLANNDAGISTVDVYAIQDTVDFVSAKLLDGSLYPDMINMPSRENPVLRLHVVNFYKEFDVLGYTLVAIPTSHSVPSVGFQVSLGDVRLFYTGDTGKSLVDAWKYISPNVLLTEVTYSNQNETTAVKQGHLTPALLQTVLVGFQKEHRYLPKVIVTHMDPSSERLIREELKPISKQLDTEIQVSQAGMILDL